jgi:hypothetical protein
MKGETVFALPGEMRQNLLAGLQETGKRGSRCPVSRKLMIAPPHARPPAHETREIERVR